jgi:3-demethoxyubiquinol 3-hydroxylase
MIATCDIPERAADTRAARYLRLDHLGEQIAVSIYAAQALICRWTAPQLIPMLGEFLVHERQHQQLFEGLLRQRTLTRCRGSSILRLAGWLLGAITALIGSTGVMACTAAVETVVLEHLARQLEHLRQIQDVDAVTAIESILADELAHRDTAGAYGPRGALYRGVYAIASTATAGVIAVGLHL